MKRKTSTAIPMFTGHSENQQDPRTHFWYEGPQSQMRRLCDDLEALGELQEPDPKELSIPCKPCESLYVEDIAFGKGVLEYSSHHPTTQDLLYADSMLTSKNNMGYTMKIGGYSKMDCPAIGMATFARFFDAPVSGQDRVIRDTRMYLANPKEYKHRDYYWAFRNTLVQTHWKTNDATDFESGIEALLPQLKREHRRENYEKVSEAYLRYFARQDEVQFFRIPTGSIEIAGLTILINPEIGMRQSGDNFALKLWFAAPRPKRTYRQAIQYLMEEAQERGWQPQLQPAIFDVRRETILARVPIARGFERVIRGQAAAFLEMWKSFDADPDQHFEG